MTKFLRETSLMISICCFFKTEQSSKIQSMSCDTASPNNYPIIYKLSMSCFLLVLSLPSEIQETNCGRWNKTLRSDWVSTSSLQHTSVLCVQMQGQDMPWEQPGSRTLLTQQCSSISLISYSVFYMQICPFLALRVWYQVAGEQMISALFVCSIIGYHVSCSFFFLKKRDSSRKQICSLPCPGCWILGETDSYWRRSDCIFPESNTLSWV